MSAAFRVESGAIPAAWSAAPLPEPPPNQVNIEPDYVVILAALLCGLICTVGLAVVARCSWLRRHLHGVTVADTRFSRSSTLPSRLPPRPPPPAAGLAKKIIRTLPMITFTASSEKDGKVAECPICLTEFVEGDEMRVLPQCGHVFHVNCVDTWLGKHSSCPSCRQFLGIAAGKCENCSTEISRGSHAPPGADTETRQTQGRTSSSREDEEDYDGGDDDDGGNRHTPAAPVFIPVAPMV